MKKKKFEWIAEYYITKINSGELEPNSPLPSENELCVLYDVSRTTVRKALQLLMGEGYIVKKQGLGSYVAPPILVQNLSNTYSFAESMVRQGKYVSTEVLAFEIAQTVDGNIIDALSLDAREELFVFDRLRLVDDEPYLFETSYLPTRKIGILTKKMLINQSLYKLLAERYGIAITDAHEEFRAITIPRKVARHLQLPENSPVLEITRTAYFEDIPIEYTVSYARGDRYRYSIGMTRSSKEKLK